MVERTFVLDAQLTSIQLFENDEGVMEDWEIEEYLNEKLRKVGFDDIVISKIKRFERELGE